MRWEQVSECLSKSEHGHLICAVWSPLKEAWQFMAWTPKAEGWRANLKVHYALGEPVQQPRTCLGCFSDVDQAVAACDHHQREAA